MESLILVLFYIYLTNYTLPTNTSYNIVGEPLAQLSIIMFVNTIDTVSSCTLFCGVKLNYITIQCA